MNEKFKEFKLNELEVFAIKKWEIHKHKINYEWTSISIK